MNHLALLLTMAEDLAHLVMAPATEDLLHLKMARSTLDLPTHHLQDPKEMVLPLLTVLHHQVLVVTLVVLHHQALTVILVAPHLTAAEALAAPKDLTASESRTTTLAGPHHHLSLRDSLTKNLTLALALLPLHQKPLPSLITTPVPTATTEVVITVADLLVSFTDLPITTAVLPLLTATAADVSEDEAATVLVAEDTVPTEVLVASLVDVPMCLRSLST